MKNSSAAKCESCKFRKHAEKKPGSILGRLWQWHTRWCPGWKAYQAELVKKNR